MEEFIDLSLRSIHGVGWRPGRDDQYTPALPGIKAYVSFSGSVPNMKVSSFAMCFETGNLLIESNIPTVAGDESEGTEGESDERKFLDVTFADPFHGKRQSRRQSSNSSSASEISSSSHQPHVQFPVRYDNAEAKTDDDMVDYGPNRFLKFQIVFRSVDDGVIAEGVANLEFPEGNFEDLPLILDLPITQIAKVNSVRTPAKPIYFDESACIRVHLQDSMKQQNAFSPQKEALSAILLSDNVDETCLRGMVKEIHEREGTGNQKINYYPTKSNLFGAGNKNAERRRTWVFNCGGGIDIKHSVQSFMESVRGFRTKCTDEENPELLTSPTMVSTILTRDSLEI